MECPNCGAKTSVQRSIQRPGVVERHRRCEAGHSFRTEEQKAGWQLQDLRIRHTGDKKVGPRPFDRARLLDEVGVSILHRLTGENLRDVVSDAIAQLREEAFQFAPPLEEEEWYSVAGKRQRRTHRPLGVVWDHQIRDAVEDQLRLKGYRVEHVLYVLAVRGRDDIPGREGFRTAEDALRWMYSPTKAYATLGPDIPQRPQAARDIWQPMGPAVRPKIVVKRSGEHVTYNDERFRDSVFNALIGRPNAENVATAVAWWVLLGVEGQERLHSSQLAVGVADCLRRVDDIAYLRWAIQLKDMRQVANINAEARALITHPSDRLVFDHRPRHRSLDELRRRGGANDQNPLQQDASHSDEIAK